jgi:hypothetical protein
MATGLTNKSAIPLGVHDLRVIEGRPRFNDGRLALRLDLDRHKWRQLIERHEAGAIERGLETFYRGGRKSTGGRSFEEWHLTIAQTIYYVARSKANNALDVMAEVALIVEALRTGAPIPDTPFTDALFAPERPTIERGDNNLVEVKWEQPPLPLSDEQPAIKEEEDDNLDDKALGKLTTEERHQWVLNASPKEWGYADKEPFQIKYECLAYDCILRRDPAGDPWILWVGSARGVYSQEKEEGKQWLIYNEKRVFLRVSSATPRAAVELALHQVPGLATPINLATIREYLEDADA